MWGKTAWSHQQPLLSPFSLIPSPAKKSSRVHPVSALLCPLVLCKHTVVKACQLSLHASGFQTINA
jgi:hypothetical protein